MNAARENVNQKLFKDKSDGSRKTTMFQNLDLN